MMNLIYPVSRYLRITQIYWAQHLGIDLGWWDGYSNQEIVASADGTIIDLADGWGNTYPNSRIYGNYVIIDHGGGIYTLYGHLLSGVKNYVHKGQKVKQGQAIGKMGNSGYSKGQHLHYELRIGKNLKASSVDPVPYLVVKDPSIWINPTSKEYDKIRTEYSPVQPVAEDVTRDQIYIGLSTLRCRTAPTLKAQVLGLLAEGYYNTDEQTEADGFTWYRIAPDRWCAQVNRVEYLPAETPELYRVTFPAVSEGDKRALEAEAKRMQVEVVVEPAA